MYKKTLNLLLLLSAFITAAAQSAQEEYTLKTCLRQGIENNLNIKIARNEEQIARNNATRSAAGMTPTVDIGVSDAASLTSTSQTARPSGTKTDYNNSMNNVVDASLSLGWTLFDGYKMQASYARLKELSHQGALRTRMEAEGLVADITIEYYNFVQQNIRLGNYRYAVRLSRERLRIAEERFHVGKGSGLEYQQASVDFNADSSQYIRQHELVEASRINLNKLMNVADVTRSFYVSDTLITVDESLSLEHLSTRMEEDNTALQLAASEGRVAAADLRTSRAYRLPSLRLNTGYGYTNRTYSKGSTRHSGTWGPEVGLTLGFSLFNKNNPREERNARLRQENAALEQQQLHIELLAQLHTLWKAYENNLKVLHLERENLRVALNNYDIARDRYLLGDLPGIDMREAQKSLLDARERILAAEYATKQCEISLKELSGSVGEYLEE